MQANLEWFRTFMSIYETGTLSGAAKQLFISQPGVGIHLNALETYTGYSLFERTPRKMVPTERGHLLYQQVHKSLDVLMDIEGRFRRKSGEDRPTLSVGMCVETFQQALEKHIPELDFNLIMQFGDNEKLIDGLENGSIDLVLATALKTNTSVEYNEFTSERLVVVCGRDTDLSEWNLLDKEKPEAILSWLHQQLWYNTASDMKLMNQFWQANFGKHPDFIPNYILPNKFSIIRCLSMGKGLAILPDFICREAIKANQITVLWEGYHPVVNKLYFGRRKNSLYGDQIEFIAQKLMQEYNQTYPQLLDAVGNT